MHQTISIAQEYYRLNELWRQGASSYHQLYVCTVFVNRCNYRFFVALI